MATIDWLFVQLAASLYGSQGEAGQGQVEFALIVALVAVFCVTSLTVFRGGVSRMLDAIAGGL